MGRAAQERMPDSPEGALLENQDKRQEADQRHRAPVVFCVVAAHAYVLEPPNKPMSLGPTLMDGLSD